MFPEDDLRLEFWLFVRERAVDCRSGAREPVGTKTLDSLEWKRHTCLIETADENRDYDEDVPGAFRNSGGGYGYPTAYKTLQNALLAFLVYRVSSSEGFPYSYATWLRTIVLVVTQAQREPRLLTVRIEEDENGELCAPSLRPAGPAGHREFTMTLEGSWDCLSHDTFKTIRRTFSHRG